MYRPRSYHSDIGDVEIIEQAGLLHMFHLVIPNRDLVAHAVSEDGLSWKAVAPALRSGDPGDWDDDMIRTVSVTATRAGYVMLYGATCRREGGRVERILTAISDDLMTWKKLPGCISADPRYYEQLDQNPHHVSWRDPKVFFEDGVYYCLICARTNTGPFLRRGCVGLMKSMDMRSWEVCPPLFKPHAFYDLECPQLYKIGKIYYLIASVIEDQTQRYWVSDSVHGPFRPASDPLLMPSWSHYAGRLGRFQGRDVFACWTFAREDGPSPFGLPISKGQMIKYVPTVLDVWQSADESLSLHSPHAWNQYAMQAISWDDRSKKLLMQNASAQVDGSKITVQEGLEIYYALLSNMRDFTLSGKLTVSGLSGGLCFHIDKDGAGYFLEFLPLIRQIRLVKHGHRCLDSGQPWFDYQVLQQRLACFSMDKVSFLLRHVGGELEVSLNGKIYFSTVTTALQTGCIGIFAESGTVSVENLQIFPMKIPENQ